MRPPKQCSKFCLLIFFVFEFSSPDPLIQPLPCTATKNKNPYTPSIVHYFRPKNPIQMPFSSPPLPYLIVLQFLTLIQLQPGFCYPKGSWHPKTLWLEPTCILINANNFLKPNFSNLITPEKTQKSCTLFETMQWNLHFCLYILLPL